MVARVALSLATFNTALDFSISSVSLIHQIHLNKQEARGERKRGRDNKREEDTAAGIRIWHLSLFGESNRFLCYHCTKQVARGKLKSAK